MHRGQRLRHHELGDVLGGAPIRGEALAETTDDDDSLTCPSCAHLRRQLQEAERLQDRLAIEIDLLRRELWHKKKGPLLGGPQGTHAQV